MIKCNEFVLTQNYNLMVKECCEKKGRIDIKSETESYPEIDITLWSMKQEDFRNIAQKEKFNEPIKVRYDSRNYRIFPYKIIYTNNKDNNISQVHIHGYVNYKEAPEFEIID